MKDIYILESLDDTSNLANKLAKKILSNSLPKLILLQGNLGSGKTTFSQYFANPLYLNPAFAGARENTRVVTNFRNQNPAIPGAFITYSASFDHYFQSISSGIGLVFITDKAGEAQMSSSLISGIYSYKIKVNKNLCFNTGIQASYMQNSIDWKTFTFGDQIDNKQGFVYPTNERVPTSTNIHSLDFSAGFIGYTKSMVSGITLNHLTQPPTSHYVGEDKLYYKFSIFYIGKYSLNKSIKNETFISPNIIYQRQHQYQQIAGGFCINRNPLTLGLLYRNAIENSDACVVIAGIDTKTFRFLYSYDINLSKFVNLIGGSHEFSLYLLFENLRKEKYNSVIICPSF